MATLTKGYTFGATEIVTNAKLHTLVDSGAVSGIVNADIDSAAAIADTKLDTIATPGKVDAASFVDEGDWTAAFACGTGTITLKVASQTGRYVKIGKMVTVTVACTVDSVSSPVGTLSITGLPFACGTDGKYTSTASIYATNLEATGTTTIMGIISPTATSILLYHFTAGMVGAMAADVKANSVFIISATYLTS